MWFFRLLGSWSMIVAVISLVGDFTRAVGTGNGLVFTSLGRQWFELSPAGLNALQAALERYIHPYAWDPVASFVLETPTWVVFATIGLLLYVAGRRRERVNIFAN
ncbi:MAG: hypothetical protein R3D57_02790 [Hyphomicrobiaceae bacterium]